MKKLVIMMVVAWLVSFSGAVFAAEEAIESAKSDPVVTISSTSLTKYVDENGAHYGNGAVLQSALTISLPKGFYVEVWNNTSLTKNPEGRENDLTLGWEGEVGPVEIEIGGTYIDIDGVLKVNEADLWQIFGIAKKEFQILERQKMIPFIKGEVYLPVKRSSIDKKGFLLMAGMEHGMPLGKIAELSNKLSFVYDDGAIGFQRAGLVDYDLEMKVKVVENFALVFNGRIISPMTSVTDGRRTEIIGGAGIVLSFQLHCTTYKASGFIKSGCLFSLV